MFGANVRFAPGRSNSWHIHRAASGGGQLLICTAGEGWYQEGKPAVSLREGSVVMIPAIVRHWHGARKHSWFSRIAVEVPGEGCKNEWCEPVDEASCAKL